MRTDPELAAELFADSFYNDVKMDQVALTPHLASFTDEGRQRMGLMAVEDALCVLRGEKPPHLANPGVWDHRREVRREPVPAGAER